MGSVSRRTEFASGWNCEVLVARTSASIADQIKVCGTCSAGCLIACCAKCSISLLTCFTWVIDNNKWCRTAVLTFDYASIKPIESLVTNARFIGLNISPVSSTKFLYNKKYCKFDPATHSPGLKIPSWAIDSSIKCKIKIKGPSGCFVYIWKNKSYGHKLCIWVAVL